MSTALTIPTSRWGRFWSPLLRLFGLARAMPATQPEAHDAGGTWAHQTHVQPSFPAAASTSAAAQFGWIHAAVSALVEDISGLPLKVVEVTASGRQRRVESHPVLDLLRQPASRTTGLQLTQQQIARWALTGNAYWRVLDGGFGSPTALLPLFPELVTLEPDTDGQLKGIRYMGSSGEIFLPFEQILQASRWSWEGDARGLYGASPIQALHRALLTYQAFEGMTLLATQIGQVTGVFTHRASPAQSKLTQAQLTRSREWYDRQMAAGNSAIFVPADFNFHATRPSPRDLEGKENQERVIEVVCAVFGVPSVRLMRTDAKFSNAGHAMRVYWEGLIGRVATFGAQYTRLAQAFPQSSRIQVCHDFSGVSYLKQNRTEALGRVKTWVSLGLSLKDAAAEEGFHDLPEPVREPESKQPTAPDTGSEDGERDPEADNDTDPGRQLPRAVNDTPPASVAWSWLGGLQVIEGGHGNDDGESDV